MDLPYGERLLPGSLVKVLITVDERDTLQIPNSAIVERGDIEATYVVNDSGIEMRYVRLGRQLGDFTEVLAGLVAGEHVAIDTLAATRAMRDEH
jgi:multidrug efflux pump subunit AcrA (membrane-fusion protein)